MKKEAWKPDDKEWLKARKAEWPLIVKSLDMMNVTKKRWYKYHKQLFFTGEFSITEEDRMQFAEPFDVYKLLFDLWYYPDVNVEAYQQIIDEFFNAPRILPYVKAKKFQYARNEIMARYGVVADFDYGHMGGREELMVRVYYPSYDFDDVIEISGEGTDKTELNMAPDPARLLEYVSYGILPLLRGAKVNQYYPGNYLWDHLDFALNKDETRVVDAQSNSYKKFIELLHKLKNPLELSGPDKDYARISEIAQQHRSRFENRDYGPVLMRCWDDIDDLYNALFGS